MELTALRYFQAIASAGQMTRAAEALGVTQPALSAMLKKLEAEVGAPLLDRTGRGVALTEAGRIFLAHAQESLRAAAAATQAVRELMGLHAGSIRVGGGATATDYLLPPVISRVREAHPGLRFYVREAGSSAVASAVLLGELDLGIVTLPIRVPGMGDLMTIPLVEDELRLIAPPGWNSPRTGFRWIDLAGVPFVAFEAGTSVRALIDASAAAAGVTPSVVMELRSIESIKQMVRAGIGVGLVSRFALGPKEGRPCRDGPIRRTLAIVRRRDRVPSPAVAEFERRLREAR
ncbi:MAG: LysR family transcriptional regulator [Phycisphaerae bacterium]|nr:LysR family transcriptional regulator [Phycisphaerae bacterium]